MIVYSYMCNVYSGRRMERLLHENVNYMWLSGMSRPDFRTINRFRSNRPVESEAVLGDIKFNYGFKRFRLRSNRKVGVEFGLGLLGCIRMVLAAMSPNSARNHRIPRHHLGKLLNRVPHCGKLAI